jgi:hypothetical protein
MDWAYDVKVSKNNNVNGRKGIDTITAWLAVQRMTEVDKVIKNLLNTSDITVNIIDLFPIHNIWWQPGKPGAGISVAAGIAAFRGPNN